MDLSFPISVSLIPALVAAVVLVLGVFLWRKKIKGAAVAVFAIGGFIALVFGPMLFLDRVMVTPTGVNQKTGFWFSPTRKGFQFEDLDRVLITTGHDLKGREIEVWVAEYQSGGSVTVDPGDLWESNGERIIEYMEEMGITVAYSNQP